MTTSPVLQWSTEHNAVSWQSSTGGVGIASCVSILQKVGTGSAECLVLVDGLQAIYEYFYIYYTNKKSPKTAHPQSGQTLTKYIVIKNWGMQKLL